MSEPAERSLGSPLDEPARSTSPPNVNEPLGSVGPNVPVAGDASAQQGEAGGFGATHVLYDAANPPLQAQAWAGWPVGWTPPSAPGVPWRVGSSDVVFAAIGLNSQAVADMPPVVTKGGKRREPQPAWVSNPSPQIYSGWSEFVRQIVTAYYAVGEALVIRTSTGADGYPLSFMMVEPWLVDIELVDGRRRYSINGSDVTSEICHIRYASWPGDARGHGPLEVAGDRISAVAALMAYGTNIAQQGGIPWGILKSKYALTAEQTNELKSQWVTSARSRMGAPAILGADLDLTLAQTTPKDMTLSELQKFAEARIAVLLGVPPYLLSLPMADSMTYSNVNMLFTYWYRAYLKPTKDYICQALSGFALPRGTELELSESAFVQPEPLERAQYYEIGLRDGWLSVPEIRAAERLSPDGLSAQTEEPVES